MARAYDSGVNFFDNAEGYEWKVRNRYGLKLLKTLGWSRDSFIVSTVRCFGVVRSQHKEACRANMLPTPLMLPSSACR